MISRLAQKLLLAGGFGLLAAGSVLAAPADNFVPTLVVRYSSDALLTDSGARSLYRRLTLAAAQVCPDSGITPWVSKEAKQCRVQALASAVANIHNHRLAAVYAASAKSG